jgi:hypothetical protein
MEANNVEREKAETKCWDNGELENKKMRQNKDAESWDGKLRQKAELGVTTWGPT